MKTISVAFASGFTLAVCFFLLSLASATLFAKNTVAQSAPQSNGWMSFVPGDYLYDHCLTPSEEEGDRAFCKGYVVAQAEAADMDAVICLDSPLSATTLVAVVEKFLSDHPELRDRGGAWVVRRSLEQTFPCKDGPTKNKSNESAAPTKPSPSTAKTTTFRGHVLGESWQQFIRTEGGLCKLSKENAQACRDGADGKEAALSGTMDEKWGRGQVSFLFNKGRFLSADADMSGATFSDLTFLDGAYGPPFYRSANPKTGGSAQWYFEDGGEVVAFEFPTTPGNFQIEVAISAKDAP